MEQTIRKPPVRVGGSYHREEGTERMLAITLTSDDNDLELVELHQHHNYMI